MRCWLLITANKYILFIRDLQHNSYKCKQQIKTKIKCTISSIHTTIHNTYNTYIHTCHKCTLPLKDVHNVLLFEEVVEDLSRDGLLQSTEEHTHVVDLNDWILQVRYHPRQQETLLVHSVQLLVASHQKTNNSIPDPNILKVQKYSKRLNYPHTL